MGEEWTELVWTSIGLIALAMVLVVAFNFMQLGKSLTNQVYQEQAVISERQEIRNFLPYDGSVLTGSEAFAAALDISGDGYFALILGNGSYNTGDSRSYLLVHNNSFDPSNTTFNNNLRAQITAAYNPGFDVGICTKHIRLATANGYVLADTYGTAAEFQEVFDKVSVAATGNNKMTFADLSFKADVIYDTVGKPLGIYLRRMQNGSVVIN